MLQLDQTLNPFILEYETEITRLECTVGEQQ